MSIDSLYIDSINNKYCVNTPLSITYTNKSKTPMYVRASLEGSDNNKDWHLIFEDIFMKYRFDRSPIDNQVEIISLEPKAIGSSNSTTPIIDSRTDLWIVDNRLLKYNKLFRLKFNIGTHAHNIVPVVENEFTATKIIYSRPFTISKSKKRIK